MNSRPTCKWILRGVLVAGKRCDGETMAPDARTAVVHLAARLARERKVDIAAAVRGALEDPYKKVEASTEPTAP